MLVLAKDKLKLRKGRKTHTKHDYSRGVAVSLAPYDETTLTLQLEPSGTTNLCLCAESSAARNLIAVSLRALAPAAFATDRASGAADTESVASTERSDAGRSDAASDDEGAAPPASKGFSMGSLGEDDDEGEGEEAEEFKPVVEFKIRPVDPEASLPSATKLRSHSISMPAPPPPAAGRTRGRSMAVGGTAAAVALGAIRQAQQLHHASTAPPAPLAVAVATTAHPPAAAPATDGDRAAAAPTAADRADVEGASSLDLRMGTPTNSESDGPEPTANGVGGSRSARTSSPAPPATTPAIATPASTPALASPASAASPVNAAVFNLVCIESINATFDGAALRAGSFLALGELRALQLNRAGETHALELRLEGTGNVRGMQPNAQLVQRREPANGANGANGGCGGADDAPIYSVRVPPRADGHAAPLPLLRYSSAVGYAPIPLRVVPRWSLVADRTRRLELRVAAHPALKGGLSSIAIALTMPAEVAGCGSCSPAGEWVAGTRLFTWKLAHLPPATSPAALSAEFDLVGQPATDAGLAAPPMQVSFVSEMVNLTGLQPRPAGGAAIGKVLQRFVSGKYVICSTF